MWAYIAVLCFLSLIFFWFLVKERFDIPMKLCFFFCYLLIYLVLRLWHLFGNEERAGVAYRISYAWYGAFYCLKSHELDL